MALAFAARTLRQSWVGGGKKTKITQVTLDASYVNGTGYVITKAQLGFASNETIDFVDVIPPHAGFQYTATITATGIVLRAWKTGAATSGVLLEAANNEAGLNGLVVVIRAIGN